jgi:hypothetical protein
MNKLWKYLFVFSLLAGQIYSQTTTVAIETSNNTSASSIFVGLSDFRTTDPTTTPTFTLGSLLETNPFDPPAGNVSKLNVHALMYPGFNGKILAETQTWFCSAQTTSLTRNYSSQNSHSFPQCNEHLVVGYDSDDATHAASAVDDMLSRGFDGFAADVSGGQNNCRTGTVSGAPATFTFTSTCPAKVLRVDNAVQAMMNRINVAHSTQMQFMLMEDQSAFDGLNNCGAADLNQALCFAQKIESDISYYNSTYFFTNPNTYLKNASGAPFVAFFIAEEHQGVDSAGQPLNAIDLSQCDSGPTACIFENGSTCGGTFVNSSGSTISNCWTSIWNAVRTHAPVPITMIFRNKPGLTHVQTDGSFQWVDPNPATGSSLNSTTQEDWPNGSQIDQFYSAASTSGKIAFGIAKKGFDREDAPFGSLGAGQVTAQQCGQVWLNSFQRPSATFSSTNQLPFMIVGTWDDYEEGSEVETGIDNCYTISAEQENFNVIGNGVDGMLAWSLNASDSHASPNTIDHYTIYSSTDGQNLSLFADNVTCSPLVFASCSLDVNNTSLARGNYQFFVKAVGKPSIQNHLSQGAPITLKDFALRELTNGFGMFTIGLSTRPGYAGTVSLTATSSPAGPTVTFSPQTIGPTGTSTVNVTFPNTTGTWTIVVSGTDGVTTSTYTQAFAIFAPPYLVLSNPTPAAAEITAGNSATFSVNATPSNGFNGTLTLSATGLPSGAQASFSPATLPNASGSSQMTVSTVVSTPAGTYSLTITAASGTITSSQTVSFTVDAPPPPPPPPGGGGCTGRNCLNQ